MNSTELWAFGLVAAALVGFGGILWRHMVSCSENVAVPLTKLSTQMEQVNVFIGELRDMKHLRIDPYLPHAFDDLNRRVTELEKNRK